MRIGYIVNTVLGLNSIWPMQYVQLYFYLYYLDIVGLFWSFSLLIRLFTMSSFSLFLWDRYENTVAAQFFGHTHTDSFQVSYNHQSSQPETIAYIAGSVTPHIKLNPGFRIYHIDADRQDNKQSTWVSSAWQLNQLIN